MKGSACCWKCLAHSSYPSPVSIAGISGKRCCLPTKGSINPL
ncbi:hypothetical protein [Methanobrevibacter sp.]|nr:hypothetical protein [Methanobrevibacter sp.]MEE0939063.1 hypothetical protein [Methanobrevibacter sp.]